MEIVSFHDHLDYSADRPVTRLILTTPFSREIRILFRAGQVMKEHRAPQPIVVQVLDGEIDFEVSGEVHRMQAGAILTLEGGVRHELTALKDSTVRLTVYKLNQNK